MIANSLTEIQKRIISGLLGGGIIAFAVWWSMWSYYLIFASICVFSILEFYKLLGLDGNLPSKTIGTINGLILFTLSFLIESGIIDSKYYFIIFISISAVFLIKLYKKKDEEPFKNIAYTILGVVYIALPFSLLNFSVFTETRYNWDIIMSLLILLWASDSGAYFFGRIFGKRKLFERISPKKTWEGSLGGAIVALMASYVISHYSYVLDLWQWFTVAGIIVVAGTYGDLVESLFKRSIQVKDSGSIIPGHGGFLDRFDGLLIVSPLIASFFKLF